MYGKKTWIALKRLAVLYLQEYYGDNAECDAYKLERGELLFENKPTNEACADGVHCRENVEKYRRILAVCKKKYTKVSKTV